jgi:hypothetical protein
MSRGGFDREVRVEVDRLHAREDRAIAIEMSPSRLHHARARVRKVRNHLAEDLRRRNEVGVEDREEVARAARHAVCERACFVAVA